jgi:hypothetical protein
VKVDEKIIDGKKFGWEPFQHKHHESRFTDLKITGCKNLVFKTTCPFLQFDSNGANDKRAALERVSKPELSDDF